MAKYIVIIGFPTKDVTASKPEQVFLDTDPAGIDAAMEASSCQTFFIHRDGLAAMRFTKPEPPAPKPLPAGKKVAGKKSADDK